MTHPAPSLISPTGHLYGTDECPGPPPGIREFCSTTRQNALDLITALEADDFSYSFFANHDSFGTVTSYIIAAEPAFREIYPPATVSQFQAEYTLHLMHRVSQNGYTIAPLRPGEEPADFMSRIFTTHTRH
jgi:hypothetical protein